MSSGSAVSSENMKEECQILDKNFASRRSYQDVSEFIEKFLAYLDNECVSVYPTNELNIINANFNVNIVMHAKCEKCNNTRQVPDENLFIIRLPITDHHKNIKQLFEGYFLNSGEFLAIECELCGKKYNMPKRNHLITYKLEEFPKILLLQLKRFERLRGSSTEKIDHPVDVLEELDLDSKIIR